MRSLSSKQHSLCVLMRRRTMHEAPTNNNRHAERDRRFHNRVSQDAHRIGSAEKERGVPKRTRSTRELRMPASLRRANEDAQNKWTIFVHQRIPR